MSARISYICTEEAKLLSDEIKTIFIKNIETISRIIYRTENLFASNTYALIDQDNFNTTRGKLLPGGRHTLCVWIFKTINNTQYVLKPFKLSFAEILLYYLSTRRFNDIYNNLELKVDSYSLNVKVMPIYCTGKIIIQSNTYPFVIQEYSEGKSFIESKNNPQKLTINILRMLFVDIAKNGFVVDPFLTNWHINPPKYNIYPFVEYLDLIFFNDPTIKQEANILLKHLLFQECDVKFI